MTDASEDSSLSSKTKVDLLVDCPPDKIADLTDAALRANEILKNETEMFAKFYSSIEKQMKQDQALKFEADVLSASPSFHLSTGQDRASVASSRQSFRHKDKNRPGSKGLQPQRLLKLSPWYKSEIAHKELEQLQKRKKKHVEKMEKVCDNLRAMIEERMVHAVELKKEMYEFGRDIEKGSMNKQLGKVFAEKVTRYFDDKIKKQESYVSKTRLKNDAIKQQINKTMMLLKQKEELGDTLTEIDFQQLKIENAESQEKIEERNNDFFRLKMMGAHTLHVLTYHKKKLHEAVVESNQLKMDHASRLDLITRIDAEMKAVEAERVKNEAINKKYRANMTEYKVPGVMEAVMLKSDCSFLIKKVQSWVRKVNIAEMALQTQKKKWARLKEEADVA